MLATVQGPLRKFHGRQHAASGPTAAGRGAAAAILGTTSARPPLVVSYLWRPISGVWKDSNMAQHKWAMTDSVAEVVGAEIVATRATVPLFQARGL